MVVSFESIERRILTEFSPRVVFCPGSMPTSCVLFYLLLGISHDDKIIQLERTNNNNEKHHKIMS